MGRYTGFVAVSVVAVVLACISVALGVSGGRRARSAIIPMALVILGVILITCSRAEIENGLLHGLALKVSRVKVSGSVASDIQKSGQAAAFYLTVRKVTCGTRTWNVREKTYVSLDLSDAGKGETDPVENICDLVFPGARLEICGDIKPPGNSRGYLFEHGAGSILNVPAGGLKLSLQSPDPVSRSLNRIREMVRRTFKKMLPADVTGLLQGITLGDRRDIKPGTEASMRNCGISHIVAVSGLHVGSAAMLALAMMTALGAGRKTRYLFACLAVLVVLGLANFRPSALRAAIMVGLCFGGAAVGRKYDSLAGLSIAGMAILAANPRALFDPGLQYSFAAALGIILLWKKRKKSGRVRSLVAVCAAAQLGILPLILARGEGVPVVSIAANLVAVPLVGPIIFAGWACVILFWICQPLGRAMATVTALMARSITAAASLLSSMPTVGLVGGVLGVVAMGLYILSLAGFVRAPAGTRALFRPVVLLLTTALIAVFPFLGLAENRAGKGMTALDVGQGDAILLEDRSGGTVLVDGGPDRRSVVRKLESRGVRRLDLVLITHPHRDHFEGLIEVLKRFEVGILMEGGPEGQMGDPIDEIRRLAEETGTELAIARQGQKVRISSGMQLDILYSPADSTGHLENENDRSVVAMARLDGLRVLLTGDAEKDVQGEILGMHPDIECDVLKVPHQGALDAANPEFINACRPSVAVISVEDSNRYGHPSRTHVEMLEVRGTDVFRTDMHGDIEISQRDGRICVITGRKVRLGSKEGR